MEKIPKNFEIGDKEFQAGDAFMGKSPETSQEAKIQAVAEQSGVSNIDSIDLTQLSSEEVENVLQNPNVKIFGKISLNLDENYLRNQHVDAVTNNSGPMGDLEVVVSKQPMMGGNYTLVYRGAKTTVQEGNEHPPLQISVWHPNIKKISKNSVILENRVYDPIFHNLGAWGPKHTIGTVSAEVSFTEIPEGYKELMEKKEGKAE